MESYTWPVFGISSLIVAGIVFQKAELNDQYQRFITHHLQNTSSPSSDHTSVLQGYNIQTDASDESWNPHEEPIVFVHIVKCGGTSVDRTLRPIVQQLGGNYRM